MPRAIEFNQDEALRGAIREFRQHGFASTSIKSLERATGLSSGSLYNSYGDKNAIFVKALAHYNEVVVRVRVETHLVNKPPQEAIQSLFFSLLDEPADQSHGCFLTNSAVEFGANDSIAKSGVQEGFAILEQGFQAVIDRLNTAHDDEPKTAPPISQEYSASKLLVFYQGILVLVRFGVSKEKLRKIINKEIEQLLGTQND